jgi:GNAT superfamily N-acetyltransferase
VTRVPRALRNAAPADIPAIADLIASSARSLGLHRYTAVQMEAALNGTFGVDSQLIRDQTYYVVQAPSGELLACGGWSRRRTLFGGDQRADREPGELDPKTDAAKIRAFFVHPDHARQGLASLVLAHCEAAARAAGFESLELMATLTGVPFYAARGYQAGVAVSYEAMPGVSLELVPMRRSYYA